MVWLRCRFIQAATALFFAPDFRCSFCLCCRWFRVVFCSFWFSIIPSLVAIDPIASACPHIVRHHSPALRPVFIQLARTAFVEGEGIEPPCHDHTPLLLILSANPPIKTSEPHGWLVVNTIIKPKLI